MDSTPHTMYGTIPDQNILPPNLSVEIMPCRTARRNVEMRSGILQVSVRIAQRHFYFHWHGCQPVISLSSRKKKKPCLVPCG